MKSFDLFGLSVVAQSEPKIGYHGISIGANWFRCFFFFHVLGPELGARARRVTYETYKNINNHILCENTNIVVGKTHLCGVEFTRIVKGH